MNSSIQNAAAETIMSAASRSMPTCEKMLVVSVFPAEMIRQALRP
jgi:hypothetical protein